MDENIVWIVIAAVTLVANIYKNYKKQQENDAKRVIGQPAPKAQPVPVQPVPAASRQPKPQPAAAASKPAVPSMGKSLIESDIEKFKREGKLFPSLEYTSLESTIADHSAMNDNSFTPIEEGFEALASIEDGDINSEKPFDRKPHPLFTGRDDFKKAIIYQTVLERKYI
ncbi:MAG: hypothetical protein LBR34_05315 [Prevotella sp.]|jgi:hypothetical protein|nr:hypothetical protein [Prevotella sp.]